MLRDAVVPRSNDKSNVVIGLENMPNTINYMFSIAIIKFPDQLQAQMFSYQIT